MLETFWARPAEPDARHTPDISFLLEHTTKRINECNNEAIHDVACQTWRVLKTPGGFIHSRLDNNNRRCRCRSFTGKYYTKHATFLAHESRDQFSTRRAREGIVGYTRLLRSRWSSRNHLPRLPRPCTRPYSFEVDTENVDMETQALGMAHWMVGAGSFSVGIFPDHQRNEEFVRKASSRSALSLRARYGQPCELYLLEVPCRKHLRELQRCICEDLPTI